MGVVGVGGLREEGTPPYSPPPEKTATFSTTGGGSSAKAGPPCVCHAKPNVEPAVAPPWSHARREDDAGDDGGLKATAGFVSTSISAAPAYARRDAAAVDRRGRSWWAMPMTSAASSRKI